MAEKPLYLFEDQRPDILKLEQVYDPDLHAIITDPEQAATLGLVVPSLRTIVIGPGPKYTKYDVIDVNPDNFKSTLQQWTIDASYADETYFINYGNDIFYLYFDDRVKPIQLLIDGKFMVFGEANTEYKLKRVHPTTKEKETISVYIDSNGNYISDRIPLRSVTHPMPSGWKICTNCHTLMPVTEILEGDTVFLDIYNNLGELTAQFTLITRRAVPLNDLDPELNPIVGFDATSLQMQGDVFYLFEKQDNTHLGIQPYLTFADGKIENIPIDNEQCFLYGFNDFIPSFSGLKRKILIKYYLHKRQQSNLALTDRKTRYLSIEKDLVIIPNESSVGMKISIVPLWDTTNSTYVLRFLSYTERKDIVLDITSDVTIELPFDGQKYNELQHIQYMVPLNKVFSVDTTDVYRQSTWIILFPHTDTQQYVFKDSPDATRVYGVDTNTVRRPVMHYDAIREQYFIPTSIFINKEAFLESFYYNANPPYDYTQSTAPTVPTHFTVRDLNTMSTVMVTPIEIDQYYQSWNIVPFTNPTRLVNTTVMIEFLESIADEYQIIYGVPVDVKTGTFTYQGP
jgi:hypothetical protein